MSVLPSIVSKYLEAFPNEKDRLSQLSEQLESTTDEEMYSRTNFVGHVTASGIVMTRKSHKLLRIEHKRHKIFLQPGGHIDPSDASPLAAAIREVKEETGLVNFEHFPFHYDALIPIDVDTHRINASIERGESQHFHHDFRYLFICDDEQTSLSTDRSEVGAYQWDNLFEAERLNTFIHVIPKLLKVLSGNFNQRRFYQRLVKAVGSPSPASSIVVVHALFGTSEYLDALNQVAEVATVLPKPKSIDPDVLGQVEKDYNVVKTSRESIAHIEVARNLVSSNDNAVVIFDIGGWFSPVITQLVEEMPGKILGVIEDTENGHQKYSRLGKLNVPVMSVARSPLKDNEDFLIGQSILFSADAILRDSGKLLQYMQCSVIGYGKIGRSISHHLLLRGVKPSVVETNPIRRLEAFNKLSRVCHVDDAVRHSDIVFCATGNHALSVLNFRDLKNGCYVFSVTSSDDELNLAFLKTKYKSEEVAPYVTLYSNPNNFFYLVNGGNAANFIHKATVSSFIDVVRAEMVLCCERILAGKMEPGMHEVDEESRMKIAELWMDTFLD